ncbi:MAG: biopolymer transporter ExbD [Hyphomonadaceae bacterium]
MAMQAGVLREGEPLSEINTTPLIDVMLVLLIMLIVTLPPQRHAVKLDTPVPCKTCDVISDLPEPVTVSIDYNGQIRWDGVAISRADLAIRFAAEARKAQQTEFHIQPDRDAVYGVVAHVMAAAQREGIKRMGVVGG